MRMKDGHETRDTESDPKHDVPAKSEANTVSASSPFNAFAV
jgi:hypothetical protein